MKYPPSKPCQATGDGSNPAGIILRQAFLVCNPNLKPVVGQFGFPQGRFSIPVYAMIEML